jgi:hypothetical protein
LTPDPSHSVQGGSCLRAVLYQLGEPSLAADGRVPVPELPPATFGPDGLEVAQRCRQNAEHLARRGTTNQLVKPPSDPTVATRVLQETT